VLPIHVPFEEPKERFDEEVLALLDRDGLELELVARGGDPRLPWDGGPVPVDKAIRGFEGETWLVTGAADSPIAKEVDHVVVVTPEIEESYCHTASYTCGVAAGRALQGEDVSGLATDVSRELDREAFGASEHDRFVVAGAGHDEATALEAVLKLREGAHVAAESHHTEQLLHGHLAAVDPGVRCFVLEGAGRAAERAVDAMRALGELGCGPRGVRHRAMPLARAGEKRLQHRGSLVSVTGRARSRRG